MKQALLASLLLCQAAAFHSSGIVSWAPSSTNNFLHVELSRRTNARTAVPVSSEPGFTMVAKRYGAGGICRVLWASASEADGSGIDTEGGKADRVGNEEGRPEAQQVTDEDPGDGDDVDIDAEIEKLMKGIEHGSSRNTWRNEAARRGDMDEMKMVMLLRKQMGEEDFYKVFDPRNPRIGDI